MRTMNHRGRDDDNEWQSYYSVKQDCLGECVDRDED